jgi:hypothetical protein
MPIEPPYWFPAKRYGWGWGLPMTWQGWLVLAAFLALVVAGTFLFPPRKAMAAYIVSHRSRRFAHRRMLAQGRAATMAMGRR